MWACFDIQSMAAIKYKYSINKLGGYKAANNRVQQPISAANKQNQNPNLTILN